MNLKAALRRAVSSARQSWERFRLEGYHRWYHDRRVWQDTSWLGAACLKSVSDMWNYQEIITELRPALVIEFGTNEGGATLFFATVLGELRDDFQILTVDVEPDRADPRLSRHPNITVMGCSSAEPEVGDAIVELRSEYGGPVFAILDSDHSKTHVLAELELITPLLERGDYLVVEDTNINGHPVRPDWGEGPWEALAQFEQENPGAFIHDRDRERKFGFTFAPNGFLVRQ